VLLKVVIHIRLAGKSLKKQNELRWNTVFLYQGTMHGANTHKSGKCEYKLLRILYIQKKDREGENQWRKTKKQQKR